MGNLLGLRIGTDGWFTEANYLADPVGTFTGGISIAGVCQGPTDIPDTVAQGSAAASRVLQSIIRGKIKGSIKNLKSEEIIKNARELSHLKINI
jgi:heterodisulfide reductase subunit A